MSGSGRIFESLERTLRAAGHDGLAGAIWRGDASSALPTDRALALVLVDADRIQDTVLASPRPVTIYGASQSLAEWDRRLREERFAGFPDATVLFAGGGNATLLCPRDQAAGLARGLEVRFTEQMLARCTTAVLEVSPHELAAGPAAPGVPADVARRLRIGSGGGFGGCMAKLAHRLRSAKDAARPHPTLEAPYSGPRCAETGDRPGGGADQRSEFAREHRRRGGEARRGRPGDAAQQALEQARTFDDITKDSWIGYVCIDGAGIGAMIAGLGTLEQYVVVSAALADAFALDDLALEEMGCQSERFQIILAGGDDLLLVVPAKATPDRVDVISLTASLCQRIESRFAERTESSTLRLGVGAGVVIANGLPATFAFDYARTLCNQAKKTLGMGSADRSAIDYEVIGGGSPLSGSIDELRKSRTRTITHPWTQQTVDFVTTRRPYGLSSVQRLLTRARALAGLDGEGQGRVPRSQRMALRRLFREDRDPQEALIDLLYQAARHEGLRDALELENLLEPASSEWVLAPTHDGRLATGLMDLVEVSRLLEGGR
ncbi:MAG: hypothetical protein OHK0013_01700 [Sandaracinaceae bacterium]